MNITRLTPSFAILLVCNPLSAESVVPISSSLKLRTEARASTLPDDIDSPDPATGVIERLAVSSQAKADGLFFGEVPIYTTVMESGVATWQDAGQGSLDLSPDATALFHRGTGAFGTSDGEFSYVFKTQAVSKLFIDIKASSDFSPMNPDHVNSSFQYSWEFIGQTDNVSLGRSDNVEKSFSVPTILLPGVEYRLTFRSHMTAAFPDVQVGAPTFITFNSYAHASFKWRIVEMSCENIAAIDVNDEVLNLFQHTFRRGDSNGDGTVDISDAVTILNILFIKQRGFACDDSADSNDDGSIDISDAIFLLSTLFLESKPIPSPGFECGIDLTSDSLACAYSAQCPAFSKDFYDTAANQLLSFECNKSDVSLREEGLSEVELSEFLELCSLDATEIADFLESSIERQYHSRLNGDPLAGQGGLYNCTLTLDLPNGEIRTYRAIGVPNKTDLNVTDCAWDNAATMGCSEEGVRACLWGCSNPDPLLGWKDKLFDCTAQVESELQKTGYRRATNERNGAFRRELRYGYSYHVYCDDPDSVTGKQRCYSEGPEPNTNLNAYGLWHGIWPILSFRWHIVERC